MDIDKINLMDDAIDKLEDNNEFEQTPDAIFCLQKSTALNAIGTKTNEMAKRFKISKNISKYKVEFLTKPHKIIKII